MNNQMNNQIRGPTGGPGGQSVPGGPTDQSQNAESLILFYHEQSKPCQKLKDIIPKDKKIQYVNIAQVNNIPSSITSVPALVRNNKEVLLGKKVFDYFNKTDEIEYLSLSGKGGGGGFGFSSLDEGSGADNISSSMFSSLDAGSIADGLPQWEDDGQGNKQSVDIDQLQMERDSMFKPVERQ
jgi:hypothetical protein